MDSALSYRSLYWGARKFAHSAMDAHARNDEEVFLLHAGVSVERLAKAVLAKTTPFLLMELKGNDDTLFHMAGVKEASKVRTAGAGQVIGRLRAMDVLPKKDADLDELIELRNGVAHLDASSSETFDGLATFARVSNTLIAHLDMEPEEFWEQWNGAIEIAVSEVLAGVAREVSGRIEQAKNRLARRLQDVPGDAVAIIYKNANDAAEAGGFGIRAQCGVFSYHSPRECPACGCIGHLAVNIPGVGTTPEGENSRSFYCPLCSFMAYGSDELSAAGISPSEPLFDENGEPFTALDHTAFDVYLECGMIDPSGISRIAEFLAEKTAANVTGSS
ncbi:hypothetical protein ABVB69_08155 [Streptomyces sp. NPDC000349]|uniref:hypothetical protein n=1 Tax=unclassified Streptomyces TaxID=2593676 RepID=UPI0027854639|nr:hypothetical protein [Streptomyces sp. DSM 40167]MDQ0405713.1 hypothetical protein [Streptomyces sp. DSM 40167]